MKPLNEISSNQKVEEESLKENEINLKIFDRINEEEMKTKNENNKEKESNDCESTKPIENKIENKERIKNEDDDKKTNNFERNKTNEKNTGEIMRRNKKLNKDPIPSI